MLSHRCPAPAGRLPSCTHASVSQLPQPLQSITEVASCHFQQEPSHIFPDSGSKKVQKTTLLPEGSSSEQTPITAYPAVLATDMESQGSHLATSRPKTLEPHFNINSASQGSDFPFYLCIAVKFPTPNLVSSGIFFKCNYGKSVKCNYCKCNCGKCFKAGYRSWCLPTARDPARTVPCGRPLLQPCGLTNKEA